MSAIVPPPLTAGGVDQSVGEGASSNPPRTADTVDTTRSNGDASSSASSATRYADIHAETSEPREKSAFSPEEEERVTVLARQISGVSHHSRTGHGSPLDLKRTVSTASIGTVANPFIDTSIPELDPNSNRFNARLWTKNLLKLEPRIEGLDQSARTAGVMFKNLNVHGFGKDTDFQKDVANVWYQVLEFGKKAIGREQKRKIQILNEFEGLVRSGEMCVVLGRPGSGCSTFLKTIAGETHGVFLDPQSVINYQGIPNNIMHTQFRGEVIYQAETDVHFPQLTVGQTLDFAAKARCPRTRIEGVTRDQFAQHTRDVTMAIMGLSHTLHTPVGNDFIRGVSGGERKRVSIAEVSLSRSPLQCWDNSTRGLDSATAIEFIKTLRMNTDLTGTACLLAIYQSPQSAYEQFDKAIVLYEGRQIYFGPTNEAKQYFLQMGFICPERSTDSDFLTSLTNPAERIVAAGYENRVPRTADEFAQRWKESDARRKLMREIDEFEREYPLGGPQLDRFTNYRRTQQSKALSAKSPYTISLPAQIALCMKRGFQRARNDFSLILSGAIGNLVLALIISSVFYNLGKDTSTFFSRGALLFFAILMNAFASALEILTCYAQRPIVEKHAKYALYHPFAEGISSMLVDLPNKILLSIAFNVTLYFMTNLRREVDAFFVFLLFSFMCTLVMSNIFRSIAAVSRTIHQAMPPAAIFILALMIYTGFAIPLRDMRVYFKWITYINPIGYAFEALMINEFSGRDFPCKTFIPDSIGGALPMYENVSGFEKVCAAVGGEAGSLFVNGDAFLKQSYSYEYSHLWRNFGIMIAFFFFFLATNLIATEYVSAAKSKGEILVFRKGKMPVAAKDDNEGLVEKKMSRAMTNADEKVKLIQKQTSIFHWSDVCYDIKVKDGERRLLDHVDGWVKPGTLTALMGVSGAGKTTLLDVLASRVTMGVVTGNMCVDGHQRDDSFQRKTGYVQQQDLHLSTSTVREALQFSALLRQHASIPRKEKLAYADEVIDLLEMGEYADAVVGVPGEGLNVEQRKRLTIGVELAAKPELLLFLDEPTSGLDSQTAWSICNLMRKLANAGQAILCTIHQPSALLFSEFDRLLFLAKGGKTVYFGEVGDNSSTLIKYFEKYGGHPCPPDANPAEWMLEVIGAAPGAITDKDWFEIWTNSDEKKIVKAELETMERELKDKPRQPSLAGSSEFAVGYGEQIWVCTKRVFEQYWRTPTYIYSKTFLCIATGAFIGFSFFKASNSQQGLVNQMFSIFMLLTMFGNLSQQMMPHFVTQRSLYEVRERPSKSYSWKAFMLANIVVEFPWQALMAVFTFLVYYFPVGLYRNAEPTDTVNERGALFFLFILAFYIWTSTFTHMLIAGIDSAENGGNLGNLLFSFALIFCGVLAPPGSFPDFWMFVYRASPFTYLVSGMLSTAVANTDVVCSSIELRHFEPPSGQTCGDYLAPYITATGGGKVVDPNATSNCGFCQMESTNQFLSSVATNYDERWRNFGFMMIYIVFNTVMALVLYWLIRVPKKWTWGKKAKKD